MGPTITTTKDILRSLLQSLQFACLFPAAVLVLVVNFLVLPAFTSSVASPDGEVIAVLAAAATIILSYTLYAFNNTLIRIMEGYAWRDHPKLKDWVDALLFMQMIRREGIKRLSG